MSDARIIEGIELKSNALVGELDERGGVGAIAAAERIPSATRAIAYGSAVNERGAKRTRRQTF
jgi:hypothetical protein